MNYCITPLKNKIKIFTHRNIFILAFALFTIGCNESKDHSTNVYGTYFIYSDDPEVRRFIEGQETYIRLDQNQTIVYNSTINNKPKFNIKGKFTYDEKTNTLTINWEEGNLPGTLKIEKEGESNVIRVGNTIYKKGKSS